MSIIIFPLENDKLSYLIPCDEALTPAEIVAISLKKGTPYTEVKDLTEVDMEYFDGYIYNGGRPIPSISACREIHLDKLRAARDPKLAALDVAFMRAVEQGDTAKQSEIAAKKQELRDVTKIKLPNSLEELKKVWPDALK